MVREIMLRIKSPEDAKRALGNLEDESMFFYAADGRALRNLYELRDALGTMEDAVFDHHTKKGENDFANWVAAIFSDQKLARELKEIQNKRLAKALLEYRLIWLEEKSKGLC